MKDVKAPGPRFKLADYRPHQHKPGAILTKYGTDLTGKVTYRMNALGYRGDEFQKKVRFRIAIFGESHAVGLGVDYEDSFAHQIKMRMAEAFEFAPEQINVLNFAATGTSTNHAARTVYRQIKSARIDLAIVCLSGMRRIEYVTEKAYKSFIYSERDLSEDEIANIPMPVLGYLEFFRKEMGITYAVKDILLIQNLLERRKINYIMTTEEITKDMLRKPYSEDFGREVAFDKIMMHRIFRNRIDTDATGTHGGPRTHSVFATALLGRIAKLLPETVLAKKAGKLRKYARLQRDNDPDWAESRARIEAARGETDNTADDAQLTDKAADDAHLEDEPQPAVPT